MVAPSPTRSRISWSSACRSSGTSIDTWRPITSSALYPYIRSAARFQVAIVPERVFDRMASEVESRIAEYFLATASALRR